MAKKNPESIYAPIQGVAGDELNKLVGGARSSSILSYSRWLDPLVKRSLPPASVSGFKSQVFIEDLPDSPTNEPGRIFVLCLDSTWNLEHACTHLSNVPKYDKTLVVFPRVTTLCDAAVKKHRLSSLKLVELHLDFVPLDDWVFMVPCPRCFARCFIDSDITDIFTVARALCKLEVYLGSPARVFTVGSMATRVHALLEQQKALCGAANRNPDATFFDMFIVDRTVDAITPLLTQMTYGGLLDDKFDLHYGYLDLPPTVERPPEVPQGTLLMSDQNDDIFCHSRCLPMADALDYIQRLMTEMRELPDKLKDSIGTRQWNTNGIRATQLQAIKPTMELHLNLISALTKVSWLERQSLDFEYNLLLQNEVDPALITMMLNCGHVVDAVRLLCLYSQLTDGVSTKEYLDFLRRLVGNSGATAAAELMKYEKCGLLRREKSGPFEFLFQLVSGTDFHQAAKQFNLVLKDLRIKVDADGNEGPADVGAAYDRYVPLLVRLVQSGIQQPEEWAKGRSVDAILNKFNIQHAVYAPEELGSPPTRKVLVFVIGGVTESEASIFRQMGSILFDDKVDFHIASTNLTSGRRIVTEISPLFEKKPK